MYLSDRVQRWDKTEQFLPMIVILPIIEKDCHIFFDFIFYFHNYVMNFFFIQIVFIGTLS